MVGKVEEEKNWPPGPKMRIIECIMSFLYGLPAPSWQLARRTWLTSWNIANSLSALFLQIDCSRFLQATEN